MGIICDIVDVMEWLDAQIAWREQASATEYLNNRICVVDAPNNKEIQISSRCFHEVAGIVGEEVSKEGRTDYVKYSFQYKGYTVFGLASKEHSDE